jgi:hypothetical protein
VREFFTVLNFSLGPYSEIEDYLIITNFSLGFYTEIDKAAINFSNAIPR